MQRQRERAHKGKGPAQRNANTLWPVSCVRESAPIYPRLFAPGPKRAVSFARAPVAALPESDPIDPRWNSHAWCPATGPHGDDSAGGLSGPRGAAVPRLKCITDERDSGPEMRQVDPDRRDARGISIPRNRRARTWIICFFYPLR